MNLPTNPNEAESAELERILESLWYDGFETANGIGRNDKNFGTEQEELAHDTSIAHNKIMALAQAQKQKWVEERTHARDVVYKAGYNTGLKSGRANIQRTHPDMIRRAREEWVEEQLAKIPDDVPYLQDSEGNYLEDQEPRAKVRIIANQVYAAWRAALRGNTDV